MKRILSLPPVFWQLCRFGLVGGLSTLINSAMFVLLVDWFRLAPLLANFLAFLTSFLVSYFGHSWWTFNHLQHSSAKFVRFLCSAFISLGLNSAFVWLLMHQLHQSAYVATLPMIFITPLAIFFINKHWVFK